MTPTELATAAEQAGPEQQRELLYALGLLAEEMGEALQLIGKALRFGLDTPGVKKLDGTVDMSLTPRTMLPVELGDLLAAIDFARDHRLFDNDKMWRAYHRKYHKLRNPLARDNLGRPLAPQPPIAAVSLSTRRREMTIEVVGRMTGLALERMQRWAKALIASRQPDQRLEDGDKGIYLERWYAVPKNPAGGTYIHRIIRNDKDVMHDHPWDFTSLIVAGEYQEETPDGIFNRPTGSIISRPAHQPHRLLLPTRGRECLSVVFTGPRIREWGFHCPKGWVPWQQFTDPADEGIVGRGCGEMA